MAEEKGLILVDTKYEFGKLNDGSIVLIDEIHTPDSSRYFYLDSYNEYMSRSKPPKQLSKEFFRQWLISNNFQGKKGQDLPDISDDVIKIVSDRYIELYDQLTGKSFNEINVNNSINQIESKIIQQLKLIN